MKVVNDVIINDYLNEAEIKHLQVFVLNQKKLDELTEWARKSVIAPTLHSNTISKILKGKVMVTDAYEPIITKAYRMKVELELELEKIRNEIRLKTT